MFLPLPTEIIRYIGKFLSIFERLGLKNSFEKKLNKCMIEPRHQNGSVSTLISYYNDTRYKNQVNGFHFHTGSSISSDFYCLVKNGFEYQLQILQNNFSGKIIYDCYLTIIAWKESDGIILGNPKLLQNFDIGVSDLDCMCHQINNSINFYFNKGVTYGYNTDITFGKSQILYKISEMSLRFSKHLQQYRKLL